MAAASVWPGVRVRCMSWGRNVPVDERDRLPGVEAVHTCGPDPGRVWVMVGGPRAWAKAPAWRGKGARRARPRSPAPETGREDGRAPGPRPIVARGRLRALWRGLACRDARSLPARLAAAVVVAALEGAPARPATPAPARSPPAAPLGRCPRGPCAWTSRSARPIRPAAGRVATPRTKSCVRRWIRARFILSYTSRGGGRERYVQWTWPTA